MSLTGHAAGNSLKGSLTRLTTIHGLSAYQIAQQEGFVGTEEEWLDSLKGEPGAAVTVKDVTESTADYGENTVLFSDGTQLIVRNGRQGSPGEQGAKGDPHITITKVEESTVDGGANVITFSDKTQLQIRNGKTGSPGKKGVGIKEITSAGAYNNVLTYIIYLDDDVGLYQLDIPLPTRGEDYWTSDDQSAIVNDVITALPKWEGGYVY